MSEYGVVDNEVDRTTVDEVVDVDKKCAEKEFQVKTCPQRSMLTLAYRTLRCSIEIFFQHVDMTQPLLFLPVWTLNDIIQITFIYNVH